MEEPTSPNQQDDPPMLKYEFLQSFCQGTAVHKEENGNSPCIDVDLMSSDHGCYNMTSFNIKEESSGLELTSQIVSTNPDKQPHFDLDDHRSRSCSPELDLRYPVQKPDLPWGRQSDYTDLNIASNDCPADRMSDDDESMNSGSGRSHTSDVSEGSDGWMGAVAASCVGTDEMDDMEITMSPEYIMLRDNCCSAGRVVFSPDGIRVKASTTWDNQGLFSREWGVADIVKIDCIWLQRVGMALLKLSLLSQDLTQANDAERTIGTEELKFAVVEPNWSEMQEEIRSLNVKYMTIWNVVHAGDTDMDFDNQRRYFPNFDEPFEDVIFPKKEADAVTITKKDVDLLQPEIFVNDTVIDFYSKYLEHQICPEEKHRFHFFNSFFFRKLADLDKDPSSILDGRAAFTRVRRWTRNVDLFGKEYIFIPVNYNLHWSLIVICHPGVVVNLSDEELDKSIKFPCVLHMDSIKGSHAGLKTLMQSYLCEEWKARHKDTSEDTSSKFLKLRFVSLELPQQENSFDCGLFLLHYLELFLAEAPVNFSPFKITKLSGFLTANWFPPAEASLKRAIIQKMVFEILENRSREVKSNQHKSSEIPGNDKHSSSVYAENNRNAAGEFLSEQYQTSAVCNSNLSLSQSAQGIEMTLLTASPMRNMLSVNDSSSVLMDLFDGGVAGGSLLERFPSFDQPSSSFYQLGNPMPEQEPEDVEIVEHIYYPPEVNHVEQNVGCVQVSSPGGFGPEMSWNPGIDFQYSPASEATTSSSDDSEGIIEGINWTLHQQEPQSVSDTECLEVNPISDLHNFTEVSVVERSGLADNAHENNEKFESACQESKAGEKRMRDDSELTDIKSDVAMAGEDSVGLIVDHEQEAAKRPRLNPNVEGETGIPEAKDFIL